MFGKKNERELKPIEADAVYILDKTCELATRYIKEGRFTGVAPKDVVSSLLIARQIATQEQLIKILSK